MNDLISNLLICDLAATFKDEDAVAKPSAYWSAFLSKGSHLWMDTGDIAQALALWSSEFSALTTNNTLLNKEVQKGDYDHLFVPLAEAAKHLDREAQVREIAFAINAIHGLRLVHIFGSKVSVELHTDYAHDVEGTYQGGMRLHKVCPSHFIVKVPFTAAGLIAARRLHEAGVPVNLTLGFSVRQNVIASLVARPAYCNVFVGRIGAYFENNKLGDGGTIGEKITRETQLCMRKVNDRGYATTRLIAASIRTVEQLLTLSGCDVLTVPSVVVKAAAEECKQPNVQLTQSNDLGPDKDLTKRFNLKHLWQIHNREKEVALHAHKKVPDSPANLIDMFHHYGCHDIFPVLSANEHAFLRQDGKIPVHSRWADKMEQYQVGIDSLLNMAGLYAFMEDQMQLDAKIREALS
ncbi:MULTISPECIES: transaldolase family protein [unclassified Carboxylicivirga]|uniref:transaldolase family protein n=1 Tax=Carboxylicivirga TaxID=1628153 RepID=UPI003D337385